MGGIVGIVSKHAEPLGAVLRDATASLIHRGPDHQWTWVDPTQTAGLGHCGRGAIERGVPGAGVDDRAAIVCAVDGELFSAQEICDRYAELGAHCVSRLRGEFAFVLWDARNKLLLAARDRFGLKPLVYAVHRDSLYLASEAKALFAAGLPAAWDRESFHQFVHFFVDPDRTLFDSVHQIPAGHYLMATRHSVRIVKYWDIDFPTEREPARKYERAEFVDRFRHQLDVAVQHRTRSGAPVGVALSGGLDSSAVLALAAEHHPVSAFTIGYGADEFPAHRDHDESATARRTAEQLGATFFPVSVRRADMAEHFARTIHHFEWLADNGNLPSLYMLYRAMRDAGCQVAFVGIGSDEVLGAYSHVDHLGAPSPDVSGPLARLQRVLGFVPELVMKRRSLGARISPLLRPELAAEFSGRDPYLGYLSQLDRSPVQWPALMRSIHLRTKTRFVNYAAPGERVAMASGLELRYPFLDQELVELLRDMPLSLYVEQPPKTVLREAMRSVLPARADELRKWGFQAPPDAPHDRADPLHELTQDVLRGARFDRIPLFDQRAVIAYLDGLTRTSHDDPVTGRVLRTLLSAGLLHEQFELRSSLT